MQLHYINTAFQGNYEAIAKRLRVDEDMEDEFRDIYDECVKIAAPKGVFTECEVTQDGTDTFMNGKRVRSKVVYSAFQGIEKAYPHVVTCGRELYDFAMRTEDPLERFWIDGISEAALGEANAELHRAVQ